MLSTIGLCFGLLLAPLCANSVEMQTFVVVIDAGHGGHDPGASGKISKEKDINLHVALLLGKLIQTNCPDVKVVYTRRKDEFIPLDRRAAIANNAQANLFISIHTNSLPKGKSHISGASTWTLGLAKSEENLEVAKRENAVILYESDYQTRYAGFNPNSAESYIIFEFMQDKYMSQSVHLASLIQQEFRTTCRRTDRGVHQAGFLVLKASAMPGILIELGFISNPEEERYLNSEKGSQTLANGIYQAFLTYKQEQEERRKAGEEETKQKTPEPETTDETTVFKIQLLIADQPLAENDQRLKGLKASYYKEDNLYKYIYGASADYNRIEQLRQEKILPLFKDAFVVAFKNGQKINTRTAITEYKNNNNQKDKPKK
jgi:N-acetylmuramoyl-L-alanine amidase